MHCGLIKGFLLLQVHAAKDLDSVFTNGDGERARTEKELDHVRFELDMLGRTSGAHSKQENLSRIQSRDDNRTRVKSLESRLDQLRGKLSEMSGEKSLDKVEKYVRNNASYILSRSKSATPSNYGLRTSIIPDSTSSQVVQIGERLTPRIRREWKVKI